ncbi:hypothetical protein [Butyrivibrio proteoclasticus]|uniref:hypothetical protein n=1 Tax=Butyrivibrio proteoclasticus TaxID=43305 RepID=UPI00047A5D7A|nr:hypothetical protein [Butyrivibrio proteoclasticus]
MERIDDKKYQDALADLDRFKENAIKEELAGYTEEYKSSKWFREPSLKDAVGEGITDDFSLFYSAINGRCADIERFVELFDAKAVAFGKSWYDEDLCCERTGYEWETSIYVRFRNIAAEILGLEPKAFTEYYEGTGEC